MIDKQIDGKLMSSDNVKSLDNYREKIKHTNRDCMLVYREKKLQIREIDEEIDAFL